MDVSKWSYNDFKAYLLLYAANADLIVVKEEEDILKQIVSKKRLSKLKKLYSASSDYEIIQTIMSFKEKYFSSDDEKDKLLDEIKKLFMADSDYSILEKNTFIALQKIL
ncbi:MAG: hypothetical protein HN729_07160 [Candidatus Marinimicrobia bacterium]|jgi:hypothetical protein|nr:hypothetical protein [Candidatus Neomarinimicrobiota bacterium]MBT3633597.1 hypothetical protein [Candidatus Neomarinimicrobiota bacterium]MBT3682450.1 hypothetical protein [Candidatus Neomarinimicrobiota bacterium]MBT3759214.1 hypothetical protein [Candidatus Neomarinimicrobiota bacterium]MBT3895513.1 hypothetical protein [Candidatus Neomarinimicrobiota bacterium]